jgi:hypothetical protein
MDRLGPTSFDILLNTVRVAPLVSWSSLRHQNADYYPTRRVTNADSVVTCPRQACIAHSHNVLDWYRGLSIKYATLNLGLLTPSLPCLSQNVRNFETPKLCHKSLTSPPPSDPSSTSYTFPH